MSADISGNAAFRWNSSILTSAVLPASADSASLIGLDNEKRILNKNIEYMLKGGNALNVLLWGDKGSGKSSLIRSLAVTYAVKGLRMIEFCDENYYSIYDLYRLIRENRNFGFAIYFDDVSFDNSDKKYRNFKSIVEGGLEEKPRNLIFIATSNRRHLVNEKTIDTNDIYNRDEQNESSSLFARFGITMGFYPVNQDRYLQIVEHYINKMNVQINDWQQKAVNYALEKGGRSGRVAQQFVIFQHIQNTD